ncbi:MAG: PepSY-associated TM helix domain-containing protein [Methylococcales bacterium]
MRTGITNGQGSETSIRKPKPNRSLKWLRRLHAWVGLWAAVLGLLFGLSGFLLNHRAAMKIPLAKTQESEIELALAVERPNDAETLAKWLQAQLKLDREASKITVENAKAVRWANREIQQPAQWRVDFHSPRRSIRAEYRVGNAFVSVKRQDGNLFEFMTRLHKGVGMGIGWVLLTDTLALGLVFLCVTGLLMWTRTRDSRITLIGLGITSFLLALAIVLNSF